MSDKHVKRTKLGANAPENALHVKGGGAGPLGHCSDSEGATKRNIAPGSMKRRISQGQAMRSIFGRVRVTHTVCPPLSRGGTWFGRR